jgi:hypothetical protein
MKDAEASRFGRHTCALSWSNGPLNRPGIRSRELLERLSLPLADDRQVRAPRADGRVAPARHDACDLRDVREVVSYPGRQVLPQRHHAELGMPAATFQILHTQIELFEVGQTRRSQTSKFVQLERDRARLVAQLHESIEGLESHSVTMPQQVMDARHPVGPLPRDQVTNDGARTPRPRAFVAIEPLLGQSAQPFGQDRRRVLKNAGGAEYVGLVHRTHRTSRPPGDGSWAECQANGLERIARMTRMLGRLLILGVALLGLMLLGWVATRSTAGRLESEPLERSGVPSIPEGELKAVEVEPSRAGGHRQPDELAAASAVPLPTPKPLLNEGPRKGLDVLAENVREMRRLFLEHKSNGSAMFLIERSIYLREDVLGRSYSLDQPIPAAVDKRDFWIAVNGPNGHRFYQFGKDEYPLYWKYSALDQASAASHAAIVDQRDMDEVLAFADESLAMFEGRSRR